MNLNDVKDMVKIDLIIDQTALDAESSRTPQLHNKYLCIMLDEKLILKKQESDLAVLRKNKWLYYLGKMSEEQLTELGWEAFELAITRQDVEWLYSFAIPSRGCG